MSDAVKKFAEDINNLLPNIKYGTLRFFGVWFGRPYDNIHKIIEANFDNDILRILFNEDEILEVSQPNTCHFSLDNFEILNAKKVLWKWYYYGRPKIDKNLYFYNFEVEGKIVKLRTNVTWFVEKQVPDIRESAVKIY